jgi:hypothetical protein
MRVTPTASFDGGLDLFGRTVRARQTHDIIASLSKGTGDFRAKSFGNAGNE